MIQFSYRFAFLSTFRLLNRTPKKARILTLYQTNAATLTPLSKEDKILIKSLQECKGYTALQFITEFMNKGWTKNSINRLLVKFRTVDRRLGISRRSAHTDERKRRHSWVAVAESGRQTPETSEISHEAGDPTIISFVDYSQSSASQVLQEKARSTADWSAQHAITRYFRYAVWETITW